MRPTAAIALQFADVNSYDVNKRWQVFELGKSPLVTFIAVGIVDEMDGDTRRLSVLAYDLTNPTGVPFNLMAHGCHLEGRRVKVTNGDVLVKACGLRGCGVGSVVFSIGVEWAKLNYPDMELVPIRLVRPTEAQFDQLTRFYGQFGFKWDRPVAGWGTETFPSNDMKTSDLQHIDLSDTHHVRQVDIPKTFILSFNRILELQDSSDVVKRLKSARGRDISFWRRISSELNYFAWALWFAAGCATSYYWPRIWHLNG